MRIKRIENIYNLERPIEQIGWAEGDDGEEYPYTENQREIDEFENSIISQELDLLS